ncbi:MAG: lamin tail domain-containing protein [Candidatus Omnitrophota bacterium]
MNKEKNILIRYTRSLTGFTILEIILVIGLLSLIVVAIAPFFRTTVEGWDVKDRQLEVMQHGRVGMDRMVKTIKSAKQFSAANASDIGFMDADDTEIEFRLNGGALEERQGGSGPWDDLSEPVDSLSFTYYDKDGNTTTSAASVRSVKIAMTVSDSEGKVSSVTFNSQITPRKDFATTQLAINEINYNAPGSGSNERKREWVELYNYGTTDVDLTGWQLSDSGATDDLQQGNGTMIVPAGGYAIITANPTDVYSYYTVDPSAIRIEVDDSSIGNGLSDKSDTITILDPLGSSVDVVTYDDAWGGDGDGDTIERKDETQLPSDPSNWEASSDTATYTAGTTNTVTP